MSEKNRQEIKRTAGEAGWHLSRYNLSAPVPGKDAVAIANLFKGTCAEYSPLELYLLSVLDRLDEIHHVRLPELWQGGGRRPEMVHLT